MNIQIDGKTVAYSNGSGHPTEDAPLIVFLHGAGMDHSVWVMRAVLRTSWLSGYGCGFARTRPIRRPGSG